MDCEKLTGDKEVLSDRTATILKRRATAFCSSVIYSLADSLSRSVLVVVPFDFHRYYTLPTL